MKKIRQFSYAMLLLFGLVACKEEKVAPTAKIEAKVGETFTVSGPTEVSFVDFESGSLKIEFKKFSDYLEKGIVSPRTYVDVTIIGETSNNYQIETGYSDICYAAGDRLCNELNFEVKAQSFQLKFEEIFWSKTKKTKEGIEYIAVDSAQLIVEGL